MESYLCPLCGRLVQDDDDPNHGDHVESAQSVESKSTTRRDTTHSMDEVCQRPTCTVCVWRGVNS